jgi:hypothetical protein
MACCHAHDGNRNDHGKIIFRAGQRRLKL